MRILAVALPLALALATPLAAQGVITDGTATFEWGGNNVGSANIIAYPGANDQLGAFWWWYRLNTDAMETEFPYPPAGNYVGNAHDVSYSLPFFDADIETTISSAPTPGFTAILASSLTVTSTAAGPISISLFNAADINVSDSASNDNAQLFGGPMRMFIFDDSDDFCEYNGVNSDNYSAAIFPGTIEVLSDVDVDDFDSTGLPIDEANVTGGFQLTVDLQPGESATMCVTFAVNTDAPNDCSGGPPPPPNDPFIRGDFDGNAAFNALVDGLALLAFGFQGGPPAICPEAADVDGDGTVNALVDVLYMLAHGFQGGPPPGAPYPDCGPDPDIGNTVGCAPNACP